MIRRNANGYTIIETMMFLIISASLFGTVIIAMTQQNRRNQFTQSVDAMQVKLQDVLNDVSTGFYPYTTGYSCGGGQNGPMFSTSSTKEQGANQDCVFVGKALQFEPQGEPSTYNVYTMVGNRQTTTNKDVESLEQAKPVLMGVKGRPGLFDTGQLTASVEVTKVINASSGSSVGGLVIVSDFSKKSQVGNIVSGNSSRVSVWPIDGTSLKMQTKGFADTTEVTTNINNAAGSGVVVCIQESGGGRKASLTIGGGNQQLSVERTIDSWPAGCNP